MSEKKKKILLFLGLVFVAIVSGFLKNHILFKLTAYVASLAIDITLLSEILRVSKDPECSKNKRLTVTAFCCTLAVFFFLYSMKTIA